MISVGVLDNSPAIVRTRRNRQRIDSLLPLLNLITHTEIALDELIGITGRAAIEAVLVLSAQEVAGAKHPGKKAGDRQVRTREKESAESK